VTRRVRAETVAASIRYTDVFLLRLSHNANGGSIVLDGTREPRHGRKTLTAAPGAKRSPRMFSVVEAPSWNAWYGVLSSEHG